MPNISKITFRPYGPRVAIRPVKPDETTVGGLVLPDIAQTKKSYGQVVYVNPPGPDAEDVYEPLAVGDYVCYQNYVGTEVPASTDDPKDILVILEYHEIAGWYRPERTKNE